MYRIILYTASIPVLCCFLFVLHFKKLWVAKKLIFFQSTRMKTRFVYLLQKSIEFFYALRPKKYKNTDSIFCNRIYIMVKFEYIESSGKFVTIFKEFGRYERSYWKIFRRKTWEALERLNIQVAWKMEKDCGTKWHLYNI